MSSQIATAGEAAVVTAGKSAVVTAGKTAGEATSATAGEAAGATTGGAPDVGRQVPDGRVSVQDVLVEEVSIDGMCGVY